MGVSRGAGVPDGIDGSGVGLVGALGSFQSAIGQVLLVTAQNKQTPSYTGSGAVPDRRRPWATALGQYAHYRTLPRLGVGGQQLHSPYPQTLHGPAVTRTGRLQQIAPHFRTTFPARPQPLSAGLSQMRQPAEGASADDRHVCLLYTSDAADDLLCVDLGGR